MALSLVVLFVIVVVGFSLLSSASRRCHGLLVVVDVSSTAAAMSLLVADSVGFGASLSLLL